MNEPKPWLTQPDGIAKRLDALIEASGLSGKALADRLDKGVEAFSDAARLL